MSGIDRVTFVIHTYERPQFMIRLIRYFDSVPTMRGARVIVADGSNQMAAAPFDQWLDLHPPRFDFRVERHPGTTLMERLELVLRSCETPFVILGADDDFYLFDWIETATAMMNSEPELGVVFGQFMTFRLSRFDAWGENPQFEVPQQENPPLPWLEGESATERLEEIASRRLGLASAGWYALQRTVLLRSILAYGSRFRLEPIMFERFMIIAQAASAKIRMLDQLFIIRQVEPGLYREPFGYRRNRRQIADLLACCKAYLIEQLHFSPDEAMAVTAKVMSAEIEQMQAADRKRCLRWLANRAPFLRRVWRRTIPPPLTHVTRDARLPATPSVTSYWSEQRLVEAALKPDKDA